MFDNIYKQKCFFLSVALIYSLFSLYAIMLFLINETAQNKLFAKRSVLIAEIKFLHFSHRTSGEQQKRKNYVILIVAIPGTQQIWQRS